MGVITYEMKVNSAIPASKLFKAFILEGNVLIPKVLPQAYKSVDILEGDGGPGSIKNITFGDGSKFNYVKHKVEAVDKENLTYSYSVIEGDALMNVLEKITYEIKIEDAPEGGSISTNKSTYYTIGDYEITEEQIKAGKDGAFGMFKAVEAYLLENPDAYN